jgi:phospholipase D1/2
MTPVPNPPEDTTASQEDAIVADPLSNEFETLWKTTAKQNSAILLDVYKTVPNNLVKSWKEYDVRILYSLRERNI